MGKIRIFKIWSIKLHVEVYKIKYLVQVIFFQTLKVVKNLKDYHLNWSPPKTEVFCDLYAVYVVSRSLLAIIGKQVWIGCECEYLNGLL